MTMTFEFDTEAARKLFLLDFIDNYMVGSKVLAIGYDEKYDDDEKPYLLYVSKE